MGEGNHCIPSTIIATFVKIWNIQWRPKIYIIGLILKFHFVEILYKKETFNRNFFQLI